jgi:hypothetical protein
VITASGSGGGAATLGVDSSSQLAPLAVDFHEPGFVASLAKENQQGFWFQMSEEERKQAASPWGPQNPQALNRYSYVRNNPLRYTDPSGHANTDGRNEGGAPPPPPPGGGGGSGLGLGIGAALAKALEQLNKLKDSVGAGAQAGVEAAKQALAQAARNLSTNLARVEELADSYKRNALPGPEGVSNLLELQRVYTNNIATTLRQIQHIGDFGDPRVHYHVNALEGYLTQLAALARALSH